MSPTPPTGPQHHPGQYVPLPHVALPDERVPDNLKRLPNDLGRGQITYQPHRAGVAETAIERAADLA